MRLFVGLAPPPAVLDDLDAACAPFRPLRDDLRWTSREDESAVRPTAQSRPPWASIQSSCSASSSRVATDGVL